MPAEAVLPPEVTAFIEQRNQCDLFRQEPWPEGEATDEQERRAFISAQRER